jgi:hypothetical protein
MHPFRAPWLTTISRKLYSNNPFYLISVLLVLFGLHRATAAAVDWKSNALTIGVLFGYTLLLALAAFAVVRFGKVWDDARTMFLLLVLLFLAISVRFDVISLSDPRLGAVCLLAGFAFAVGISEGLLRSLRIRLSAVYRRPYYLLLVLFFSYPLYLALLSVQGQDRRMTWCVFLFPAIASAILLTLWPAARRKEASEISNGTPWTWPWYPWSLFVVMVVAIGLRSYWLSNSFQAGRVGDISFQPYFLIPLGLVTAFLLLELATTADCVALRRIALGLPLGLLLVAFPGDGRNKVAADFLNDLCQHLGSPAQIAMAGLIGFYFVAWIRGVQVAEWGVMSGLAATAWISSQTISLTSIGAPSLWPLHCVAAIQLILAVKSNRLWRVPLPVAIELGVAWHQELHRWPTELAVYFTLHMLIVSILLAAALLNDPWSRRLRLVSSAAIPVMAMLVVFAYGWIFPSVPRPIDVRYVAMLTMISLVNWRRTERVANLVGALSTVAVLTLLQLRQVITPATETLGGSWVAWGVACLLIAVAISSLKGGANVWMRRHLVRFNDRWRYTKALQ